MDFKEDLNSALEVLQKGGLILYPADIGWAIGCDGANPEAVEKLLGLEDRLKTDDISLLIENEVRLNSYVQEVPEMAYDLIELSEKPITIVYPEAKNLPENLIPEDGSIAIRVTNEQFTKTLCQKLRKPLVFTSATIGGDKVPGSFDEIADEVIQKVDYVVKYRQSDASVSAKYGIIRLGLDGQVKVIRE